MAEMAQTIPAAFALPASATAASRRMGRARRAEPMSRLGRNAASAGRTWTADRPGPGPKVPGPDGRR